MAHGFFKRWFGKKPRCRPFAKKQRPPLWIEQLEDRTLMSVQPISLADPSRYGDTADRLSQYAFTTNNASLSSDGQLLAFFAFGGDNLVPGGFQPTANSGTSYVRDLTTGAVSALNVRPDGRPSTGSATPASAATAVMSSSKARRLT